MEKDTCPTKTVLREVFKRTVRLLEKAKRTAPFPVIGEIEELERYIDTVVTPNILIGNKCEKGERDV